MSVWVQAKSAAGRARAAAMRGARRGRLELQVRRLRSGIQREEARIGRALYPMLAEGRLELEAPEVQEAVERIGELHAELEEKRALIAELGSETEA